MIDDIKKDASQRMRKSVESLGHAAHAVLEARDQHVPEGLAAVRDRVLAVAVLEEVARVGGRVVVVRGVVVIRRVVVVRSGVVVVSLGRARDRRKLPVRGAPRD